MKVTNHTNVYDNTLHISHKSINKHSMKYIQNA